ncbi:MAG: 4-(cytidine 5'-diphospho)-2-C-methyl-D-erythritol kinase [Bacteroidetes bacterium CHB5]|nr:4-(cytidine 5'-diphospho)-2-C-methyl-D-erythritol kinase [Bacteroidetes bacterium CHB5]
MVSFPHCKINLGLHIVAKRDDGYHNIETCFYPVPRTDILEVIKATQFEFTTSGLPVAGLPEQNLCVKAYRLLVNDFKLGPVKIHLHKILPMGAGVGGGSADAAFILRTLNSLFQLKLSQDQLKSYALELGSDCAFFLQDQPMLAEGRGEVLSAAPVNLKGKYLVLVKPNVHVATADAYAGVVPAKPAHKLIDILQQPLPSWREQLVNDFETSIFKKFPELADLKMQLYNHGAGYASMSGSGASVFGIFDAPVDLRRKFNNVDYWAGTLG